MNAVDGPLGLWQSSNRAVTATIRNDATLAGPTTTPNRCDVTGQIFISSLFAKIFGNFGQTVNTTSSAGLTPVNKVLSYAPLLVSLNDTDPQGDALKNLTIGSTYTVEIKDKSSNSVWILNPGNADAQQIQHLADPSIPGPTLPPLEIGDTIKSDNGQKAAGKLFNLLEGDTVLFVVTADNVGTDYLAKGQPVHTIIGFMALKVTNFDNSAGANGYSLTGTLEPLPIGSGSFDPNDPFKTQITTFAPFLVRLVQ